MWSPLIGKRELVAGFFVVCVPMLFPLLSLMVAFAGHLLFIFVEYISCQIKVGNF